MAFMRNDAINRVNIHTTIQAFAQGSGGLFFLIVLLQAGVSIAAALLALLAGVYTIAGGLRAAMGYVGAADLTEFREKARFIRVSGAALRESHVHDVSITRESPNYSRSY